MKAFRQKFQLRIDFELSEEPFDVKVINLSGRKGFIDIEAMSDKLREVFDFMQKEGMDELRQQVQGEQLH